MRKVFSISALAVILSFASCRPSPTDADRAAMMLLSDMTLEEKIGQMNQMPVSSGAITGPMSGNVSCDEAVKKGWCGSIVGLKDPDEMLRLQHLAVDSSRLGIPLLFGNDIIHGCRTLFPENIGISCTWDIDAVERFARVSAREAAAFGTHWTFSPMCDVSADPRWGRVSEGSGEDTYLAARIAEAMVRGYQGGDLSADSTVMACVKHFAAYGAPEGGRDYNTVDMSWPMFRDRYLPVYQAALEAGAGTVMSSFNDFDCVPVTASRRMLRSTLRDSLGFEGFVVSDWAAVRELIPHGVAGDGKEAACMAFTAGVSMDMASGLYLSQIGGLVESGRIREKDIDEMVLPILKAKYALGLFEDPFRYGGRCREEEYSARSLETARELARKSMVLLKNDDNVLPLKTTARIALVGPYADSQTEMSGAWRGMSEPGRGITFRAGLQDRFGQGSVVFAEGCRPREAVPGGIREAVALAKRSDIVLLTMGLPSSESGEAASLASLELPSCQTELFHALKATGKPVAVLLVTGRPLVLGEVAETADAILVTWHPGTMAGAALADLVSGDFSPSGRLTMGFPVSEGQLPLRYNAKMTGRPVKDPASPTRFSSHYLDCPNTPLFVFGSGLSYTEFAYGDLEVLTPEVREGEDVSLCVTVTNTGAADAEETVQLYVRDLVASTTRPSRELKAFAKVFLRSGESAQVPLMLRSRDLAFFTARGRWEAEPGEFSVYVGHDSRASLAASFRILP